MSGRDWRRKAQLGGDRLRVGARSGAIGSREVESSAPGRITARAVVIEGGFFEATTENHNLKF